VKLDLDMLATVPDDPPAAGPDRALDPDPSFAADADADVDVARPTESPINGHITAAATIRPILLPDSNRRTLGGSAGLAVVTEGDRSVEGAGGADRTGVVAPEFPTTFGADVALETGRAGRVSGGLVSS
jgi:hypothetical protein